MNTPWIKTKLTDSKIFKFFVAPLAIETVFLTSVSILYLNKLLGAQ